MPQPEDFVAWVGQRPPPDNAAARHPDAVLLAAQAIAERLPPGSESGIVLADHAIPPVDAGAVLALPALDPEVERGLLHEKDRLQGKLGRWSGVSMGEQARARARIREINAVLQGGQQERDQAAWLKKRATGALGEFDPDVFEALIRAGLLPGWQIRRVVAGRRVNGNYWPDEVFGKHGGVFFPEGGEARAYNSAQRAQTEYAALRAKILGPLPVPEDGVPGALYGEVGPLVSTGDPNTFKFKLEHAIEGIRLTAPDGESKDVPLPPTPAIWKWVYSKGLAQTAVATLPEAERRVPPPRQVAKVTDRTCPICFQRVGLLANGTIALHGYAFPGHQYRLGHGCPGGQEDPWEVSPEATKRYTGALRGALQHAQEHLRQIVAQPPDSYLLIVGKEADGQPKYQRVMVGSKEHELAYARDVQTTLHTVQSLQSPDFPGIPWYEYAVQAWKPGGVKLEQRVPGA